jgi:prohibitin 2
LTLSLLGFNDRSNRRMKNARTAGLVLLAIFALLTILGDFFVIDPGERGVRVTLGSMSDKPLSPGVGLKWPWITSIQRVSVKQDTKEVLAECFSSDLQQITIKLKVLYLIPEASVVTVLRDYSGDPFEKLILPRVQEAVKEVTATQTAANIVKTREQIKITSLDGARKKVGRILTIQDLVIEDVKLSRELETAIEQKMVQQQEAEKSVYKQEQAETEAATAVIKAKGEAEAIQIQGAALEKTPKLIELKMVEKWNGVTPQVVGSGTNILLPMPPRASEPEPAGAGGTSTR